MREMSEEVLEEEEIEFHQARYVLGTLSNIAHVKLTSSR